MQQHAAAMQVGVAHDSGEQRALADAIAADDRQRLARLEREPDIFQHHRLAVAGEDFVEFERISHARPFLAEIDRPHLLVVHDLGRRALDQHRALHQHRDLLGEAEHHVHVVLDDQNGDVGIEACHHVENEMAFRGRHASRRLVEQQHARRCASAMAISTRRWRP